MNISALINFVLKVFFSNVYNVVYSKAYFIILSFIFVFFVYVLILLTLLLLLLLLKGSDTDTFRYHQVSTCVVLCFW